MVIAWLYLIVVARMQVIMLMITGMIEILGMTVIGIAIIGYYHFITCPLVN